MSKIYDVAIIGAGPAGMFTAYELIKNNIEKKIIILEMGEEFHDRHCNLHLNDVCTNCPTCNVMGGVGGSAFLYSGKLSNYPAGSKLLDILGTEESCKTIYDYVNSIFLNFGIDFNRYQDSEILVNKYMQIAEELGMTFKYYQSRIFSLDEMNNFISKVVDYIRGRDVEIRTKTPVEGVQTVDDTDIFEIKLAAGDERIILAEHVVIATGEINARWWRNIGSKLNVNKKSDSVDIGIRLEFPSEILEEITNAHKDIKLIFPAPDGSELRTYCTLQYGKTIVCNYRDYKVLDGIPDKIESTNVGGMTIFNRVNYSNLKNVDMIDYAFGLLKLNSIVNNGYPICQYLKDVMPSCEDYELSPFSGTLSYAKNKNLTKVLPDAINANLLYAIEKIDLIIPGIKDCNNIIYYPAIEKIWDKYEINENMETNIKNLYIVGDVSGHIRGIMQSAVTGIICANEINRKIRSGGIDG